MSACPLRLTILVAIAGLIIGGPASAQPPGSDQECKIPICCPKIVEKDVKKIVYGCKLVPYCQPSGCCLKCCPTCNPCPRYRKVLLKKEIVVCKRCDPQCVIEYADPCPPSECPPSQCAPLESPPPQYPGGNPRASAASREAKPLARRLTKSQSEPGKAVVPAGY